MANEKPIALRYPVTIEGMANELKKVCDAYIINGCSFMELNANLKSLTNFRHDLFISALTERWIGKKRLKLITSIFGAIQTKI